MRAARPRAAGATRRPRPARGEVTGLDRLAAPGPAAADRPRRTGRPPRRRVGGQRPRRGVAGRRGGAAAARAAVGPPSGARPTCRACRGDALVSDGPRRRRARRARGQRAGLPALPPSVAPAARRTGCSGPCARDGCATWTPGGSDSGSAAELDGAHHRSVATWEDDLLRANDVLVAGRPDGTDAAALHARATCGTTVRASRHSSPRCSADLDRASSTSTAPGCCGSHDVGRGGVRRPGAGRR